MKLDKPSLLKAVEFLSATVSIYMILSISFSFLVPPQSIELLHAGLANGILGALGVQGKIIQGESVQLVFPGLAAEINGLCTGLIEFLLLASLMLASFEVKLKKRLWGIVFALAVWLAVNPLRIALTVMQLLNSPVEIAVLTHDVLFRVSLFIVIVLAYFYWLKWATKKERH